MNPEKENIGKFRHFKFPQFFATIPQTGASTALLNRRIREFSSGTIAPISPIPDTDKERVRIKIQEYRYLSTRNKSLHPCRFITLVRFLMLKNLDEMPETITDQEYLLAWMGNQIFCEISITDKSIRTPAYIHSVPPGAMIVVESDPI